MEEKWQYQRPGFQPMLVAELQRQQRCNQFCDTVLCAEGVSVPAHSCVLSALSPQLSCALSSSTQPPSGQRRSLDFQAAGAHTLLQLVGLLYSGEMAGEGERERREALSAAAQLGIHGLVEVCGGRVEAAVQTEPVEGEPCVPRVAYPLQTIELMEGGDPRLLSYLQPPAGAQEAAPPLPIPAPLSPATAAPPILVLPLSEPSLGKLQCWGAGPAEGEEFEQFEGNIPGFISYFLNPGEGEEEGGGRRRRRPGRRRGAAAGAGPAERRASGRSRGARGLAQTVGVEKGSVRLPRADRMARWGLTASRRGVGGGAAGRRLCLRRGELRKPIRMSLKRAGRNTAWEVSHLAGERGGAKRRGRSRPHGQQNGPTQHPQTGFPETRKCPHESTHLAPASAPPPASYVPTAPALLHTASLPLPAAPPQEEPEHAFLERFLDEVLMGLDMHQEAPGLGAGRAQQQATDILDHFLRSFEQQVASCGAEPGPQAEGPRERPRANTPPGGRTPPPPPRPPSLPPGADTPAGPAGTPGDAQQDEGRVVTRSRWKERAGGSVKPVLARLQNVLRKSVASKTTISDVSVPCVVIALPKAEKEDKAKAIKIQKRREYKKRKKSAGRNVGTPSACDQTCMAPQQPHRLKRGRPPKWAKQRGLNRTRCRHQCVTSEVLHGSPVLAKSPASQQSSGDAEVHQGSHRRAAKRRRESEDPVSTMRAMPACQQQPPTSGPRAKTQDVAEDAGKAMPAHAETKGEVSKAHLPLPQLKQIKIKLRKVHQMAKASWWVLSENNSSGDSASLWSSAAESSQGPPLPYLHAPPSTEVKTPALQRHNAATPLSTQVSLGSAGSCEEPDEEEVDVIGGSSPLPDPQPITWADVIIPDDEEEEEEIDVTL